MKTTAKKLYNRDFYLWTKETVKALREGKYEEIDWGNLIEEIEDLGKRQKKEIKSRLVVLLTHLLKWQYQSQKRSNSWKATIRIQRREIESELEDSPSLKNFIPEVFNKCYSYARKQAADETGLPFETFPIDNPFSIDLVLEEDWLPSQDWSQ